MNESYRQHWVLSLAEYPQVVPLMPDEVEVLFDGTQDGFIKLLDHPSIAQLSEDLIVDILNLMRDPKFAMTVGRDVADQIIIRTPQTKLRIKRERSPSGRCLFVNVRSSELGQLFYRDSPPHRVSLHRVIDVSLLGAAAVLLWITSRL